MKNRMEKIYEDEDVVVAQRNDGKWGVVDSQGNEIVPFSRYDWISEFDSGLARVKVGDKIVFEMLKDRNKKQPIVDIIKWGIINKKGEEVLPIEYDDIRNFVGKGRISTRTEREGVVTQVYFHDLNPDFPKYGVRQDLIITSEKSFNFNNAVKEAKKVEAVNDTSNDLDININILEVEPPDEDTAGVSYDNYNYNDYKSNYGEYAGSYAQDVMGYSDDDINDAFEGDPDNYWNID